MKSIQRPERDLRSLDLAGKGDSPVLDLTCRERSTRCAEGAPGGLECALPAGGERLELDGATVD